MPVLAGTPNAAALPTIDPSSDTIGPIKLRDVPIDQMLDLYERCTGKTILRGPGLPAATYVLNLSQPVSRAEALQAIESLLYLNGVAITPLGKNFLKATPLVQAKSEAPELIEGSTLNMVPSGRVASKVFQLQFLRVGEFMPQIASILSPGAASPPVVFEKANAALITDSVSNLQRIESLAAKLDQPVLAGLQPKFYQLSSAKASEVVNKMHAILSGPLQSQIGSATMFSADDRTNQIVLICDPRQLPFFDELVARLSVESNSNTRNDVIYLKHAAAKDVATVLTQLVSGQNNATRSAGQESAHTGQTAAPAQVPGGAQQAAAAPAASAVAAALGIGAEASNQFSALLTILPEERSNSIVVSGTVDDIRLIEDLVAKIDVLLAQVRIEVVIAEVTLDDAATSGISALGLNIVGNRLVGFSGAGGGFAVANGKLTPNGSGGTDLAMDIALTTTPRKNNATILSQPNIITTHNKEGKIFVGEQRPVISSYLPDTSSAGINNGTGYRSTVSQLDIGISLTVKPLIGTDGSVQLDIKQEVNDVLGEIIIDGNPQPRIGKRSTESFVTAKSGEIIVLGGLQRTSRTRQTNRLGPIPIIGDLLGSRQREDQRTDLVFFLRPYILTNTPADNDQALEQMKTLPEAEKDRVRKALGTPVPPNEKK